MRKNFFLIICWLFLGGLSFLNAQEEWYWNAEITNFEFEGLGTVTESEVSSIVKETLSLPFTNELYTDLINNLYSLELFEYITVRAEHDPRYENGVLLVIQVQERPVLKSISFVFVGKHEYEANDLNKEILLQTSDILIESDVRIAETDLMTFYQDKGFPDISVSSKIEYPTSSEAVVIFTVNEGEEVRIENIVFTNNNAVESNVLLKQMETRKKTFILSKGILNDATLENDLLRIQYYYQSLGYLDIEVVEVQRSLRYDEKKEKKLLSLNIILNEGETWFYGGLVFSGNATYSNEELLAEISLVPGDVLNVPQLESEINNIRSIYLRNGYLFNSVNLSSEPGEDTRVMNYSLDIVERGKAHLESLTVVGNIKTKDFVVSREIPLEPGEIFSQTKLIEGLQSLHRTQYFSNIVHDLRVGSEPGLMELVITVEEGQTAQVGGGLSFSPGPDFPISANVFYNESNFRGRGQNLNTEITLNPSEQSVSLSFSEPRFLGSRWYVGGSLDFTHIFEDRGLQDNDGNGIADPYDSQVAFDEVGLSIPEDYWMEYDSFETSFGVNFGYTWLVDFLNVPSSFRLVNGYRTGYTYVTYDDDLYSPLSSALRENLDTYLLNDYYWIKLTLDNRDKPSDPTKGMVLSETFTVGGLFPYGSRDYLKTVSRFSFAVPLLDLPITDSYNFKVVFFAQTALSNLWDKKNADQTADAILDGFYIDGIFTARGWEQQTDATDLWDNRFEIRIPVIPNFVSFDTFLDVVGLWRSKESFYNMQLMDYRFGLGLGLRLTLPQFPIGFYFVNPFSFKSDGSVDWDPENDSSIGGKWKFVLGFNVDIY